MTSSLHLRKPGLIALALLALAPAMGQTGPYVNVSSGVATFTSSDYLERTSFTKRRDAIGVGYAVNDLVALDVSYFQIQEANASYTLASPGPFGGTVNAREKLSGFAFGPVFRWKVTAVVTVFTRQSAVSIKDEITDSGHSVLSKTSWGYQPSIGLSFRLTSKAPVCLGLELNRVFSASGQAKDITGFLVNLSYGF